MRIFPVAIKRTTIIQGGSGPNPTDAFSVKFVFPETSTAPTDSVVVAFSFPETVAAQTDGVLLKFSHSDSTAAPTDNVSLLKITSFDTTPAQSDVFTANISYTATDTNTAATDSLKLNITLGDTTTAPNDSRSGSLTWVGGSAAATSSGANGWTTPANAQGDTANTTVATFSDASALAAAAGILTLESYSNPDSSYSAWTITKVEIVEYASYTAGVKVGGADGWVLEGRISTGAYSIIQTTRVSFSNLTTPVVFDITSARPGGGSWTWTDITNWNMKLTYDSQVTETSSGSVDTVVLRVTATHNTI